MHLNELTIPIDVTLTDAPTRPTARMPVPLTFPDRRKAIDVLALLGVVLAVITLTRKH